MSTSIHRLVTPLLLGVLLLAACGGPAATAPSAAPDDAAVSEPASTEAASTEAAASEPAASEAAAADASAAASPTPEPLIAGPLKEVPREQTLVLGLAPDTLGVSNPWAVPGYTHQEGNAFMWEPLSYFGIFCRRRNPLAGRKHELQRRLHRAEIKLRRRRQVERRHTRHGQGRGLHVRGAAEQRQAAVSRASSSSSSRSIESPDDMTVNVTFKMPAPRFAFEVLTLKFDTGIPIVPEHVLSQQDDVNAYTGGIEMAHSGPYTSSAGTRTRRSSTCARTGGRLRPA